MLKVRENVWLNRTVPESHRPGVSEVDVCLSPGVVLVQMTVVPTSIVIGSG